MQRLALYNAEIFYIKLNNGDMRDHFQGFEYTSQELKKFNDNFPEYRPVGKKSNNQNKKRKRQADSEEYIPSSLDSREVAPKYSDFIKAIKNDHSNLKQKITRRKISHTFVDPVDNCANALLQYIVDYLTQTKAGTRMRVFGSEMCFYLQKYRVILKRINEKIENTISLILASSEQSKYVLSISFNFHVALKDVDNVSELFPAVECTKEDLETIKKVCEECKDHIKARTCRIAEKQDDREKFDMLIAESSSTLFGRAQASTSTTTTSTSASAATAPATGTATAIPQNNASVNIYEEIESWLMDYT